MVRLKDFARHIVQHTAMIRRKLHGNATKSATWTSTLDEVIADLDQLNRNTEQQFLETGGKLAEFMQAVKLISSELAMLSDVQSGADASQSLTSALNYSREVQARNASHAILGGMREEAARMGRTLSGFRETVTSFQTLGMLVRIETSRLGSAGADVEGLADDVKSLTDDVETRVSVALEMANSLIPKIERTMQEISAMTAGQAESSISAISGAVAGIASLQDVQTDALASSVRLRGRFDAISTAFNKLIVSLQFHDITRQQVEHVVEVLRHLQAEPVEQAGETSCDPRRLVSALSLQSLQLADAGEKFAVSVAGVLDSLDGIAENVLELTAESGSMARTSPQEEVSFFVHIERGCAAVLGSLGHYAKAETATLAAGADLAQTFDQMLEPLGEIQLLEFQMHRLAMNAIISASHIGVTGDALSVLAGSIQQQAGESNQRSQSLMESLRTMSGRIGGTLAERGSAASSSADMVDESMKDMRTAVAKLHTSSERSFALITQIVARGVRLGEDISARRVSFTIGEDFARTVSGARRRLQDVEELTRTDLVMNGVEDSQPELFDLDQHYTMQAQRDVHESHRRAMAGLEPVAEPTQQAVERLADRLAAELTDEPTNTIELFDAPADEMGDNVEFF